ncbi:CHAD domain-containing protein [Rhizobiales bacterium]|uniref:CYTH and CHAD domain-containing protein n=1 Tax=Hongsoonwoonella zoysiae TaxID=2821844 RepID=UPI00155FDCCC|nr:CYTH and CHAD domain-containing protein [Hongsoonwoonella zoysiae]NRG16956.1 CHAD domain-containing protein [Hongsoonwoonella zoysiae]
METFETELKLELDRASFKHASSAELPSGYSAGRPVTRNLRSIYFDTSDCRLRRAKWSLRVRKVGRDWVQTVKSGTAVSGGLSRPHEYEIQVSGPVPEPDKIEDEALKSVLSSLIGAGELIPQFETVIRRTTRMIEGGGGTEIELALDDGQIVSGERQCPITEAELELKSGSVDALYDVAKALVNGSPVRFSQSSKATRGYAFAAGEKSGPPKPKTAGEIDISHGDTAEIAFRAILRSCFDQIAHNRIVVLETEDPEGPHQLRIGLRRLRSAFNVFKKIIDPAASDELDRRARAIGAGVGNLRDLDVLIDEIVAPLEAEMPGSVQANPLISHIGDEREKVRENVRRMLGDPKTNDFLFDLAAYTEGRGWLTRQAIEQTAALAGPAPEFAARALNKQWKIAAEYGRRIEELKIEERHEMRKALKKLRYTVEFFRPLYKEKTVKPFLEKMKTLQDMFGYLNDVAMAEKLTGLPQAKGQKGASICLTTGFAIGWHEARATGAWTRAKELWDRTRKADKFWTK